MFNPETAVSNIIRPEYRVTKKSQEIKRKISEYDSNNHIQIYI